MESYRQAFAKWDAAKIVNFGEKEKAELLNNPGIIRNKLKVEAVISNAKAYLALKNQSSFSDYLWQFVDGQPIINNRLSMSEIPASTKLSVQISKDLKKRGFKFVGPTIVYAFMQAVGMVDDHLSYCWRKHT
jgi:DNA-3-methyladenine glycosylase I